MLTIALAAAAAAAQPATPPRIELAAQARATVRIISGSRITAEKPPAEAIVRDTEVRSADGSKSTARLVEFP
jgi:hypothetical protein